MDIGIGKSIPKVECGSQKGTAFLVSPSIVLTATHVVIESLNSGKEIKLTFREIAGVEQIIVNAKPLSITDTHEYPIIALQLDREMSGTRSLECVDYKFNSAAECFSFGYPPARPNDGTPISLTVINHKEVVGLSNWDLDLRINDGIKNYQGVSGAPLIFENSVVGVVQRQVAEDGEASRLSAISLQIFAKYMMSIGVPLKKRLNTKKVSSPRYYPIIQGHIPRRILPANKYNSINWLINSEDLKDPLDVIRENKRVVLLGGAGTGKSIELDYIASICSQISSGFIPISVKLNKYVPRSLNEVISEYWSDWTVVPNNELLLILDGLDEVESHYKKDAIKYIELFVEQHPDIHVIVSCRRNFYQSENDFFSGTLQGFRTFLLNDLNQEDIDFYIISVLGTEKSKNFKSALQRSNLRSLMDIPFYLVRIIETYSKLGELPSNKADLFQYLISQSLQNDIQHFKNAMDLSREQERLMQCLETVALAMEDLGRNYITNEEFALIINEENQHLLKHCTLWKRIEERNDVKWQFEHNNFQEFLAASILARQGLEQIKEFLAFPPDKNKIIPSWVNTLSFLVSLLDPEDQKFIELLRWLNESDPDMVIHFEADRVDEVLRTELFQSIFTFYEERKIWINRDKFDLRMLAHFGQTVANVEYLISKISEGHYTSRVNALKLLSSMRPPISKRSMIREMITEIIVNEDELPVIRSAAIGVLTKYKIRSGEHVQRVVSAARLSSNDTIRTYLYEYLTECELVEENIDVFLEGIRYVGIDISSEESRLINEKIELEQGIEMAKSPSSVSKILAFFYENLENLDHYFLKDKLVVIGLNAAIAYETNDNIFNLALLLFERLHKTYWGREAKDFSIFFDKSYTKQKAICLLLKRHIEDEAKVNLRALGLLVDEESIEFVSQQYLNGKLSTDDIWIIQQEISPFDIYMAFNKHMNEVSDNKFLFQKRGDYEQERKAGLMRDIDLLFDKEAFLEHAKKIYVTEEKETFNQEEIIHARVRRLERDYSALVIDQIYRIAGTGVDISYEQVVEEIQSWDWDYFSLSKLHNFMSSSADVTLTDKQTRWVSEWCVNNVKSFSFKLACRHNPGGGYTVSELALIFWYFQRKYNLNYPTEVMLDMISFDWVEGSKMVRIEYLESFLDIEAMSERVWENLQDGIEIDDILNNHIDFCYRHSIQDVLPHALRICSDTSRNFSSRTVALKTYLKLSTRLQDLIDNLPNIHDNFKWEIVRQLFDIGKGLDCEKYLLSLLDTTQENDDSLQPIKFLMNLQNLDALKRYVDWVKVKVRNGSIIELTVPLNTIRTIDGLPYLIELLGLTYDEGFKQNDFERVDSEIKNAISNVAIQSSENFIAVKTSLEGFIKGHSQFKHINFLYVFIEDIESKYYITLQSGRDISEVRRRLQSTGLLS